MRLLEFYSSPHTQNTPNVVDCTLHIRGAWLELPLHTHRKTRLGHPHTGLGTRVHPEGDGGQYKVRLPVLPQQSTLLPDDDLGTNGLSPPFISEPTLPPLNS